MLNLCQFLVNRVFRGQVETDSFQNLCLDFGILLCRLVDRAESIKFPQANRVDLIELGHQEKDGCSDQLEFLVGKGHFEGKQFVEESNSEEEGAFAELQGSVGPIEPIDDAVPLGEVGCEGSGKSLPGGLGRL